MRDASSTFFMGWRENLDYVFQAFRKSICGVRRFCNYPLLLNSEQTTAVATATLRLSLVGRPSG